MDNIKKKKRKNKNKQWTTDNVSRNEYYRKGHVHGKRRAKTHYYGQS